MCSSMDIAVLMKDGETLLENKQYDAAQTIFQKVITLLNEENSYSERLCVISVLFFFLKC